MIYPQTLQKAPKAFLSYQATIIVIIFIVTLPLEFLFFLPGILLIIAFIYGRIDYNNFSFSYDEKNIEIKKGTLSKSQKTIPFNTIQNVNLNSGWLMRMFKLQKVEIWTSSPAQIQIFQSRQQGYQTEHKPDGLIYLENEDAETLKNYIISHKQ